MITVSLTNLCKQIMNLKTINGYKIVLWMCLGVTVAHAQMPDFTGLVEKNSAAVVSINGRGERRERSVPRIPIPEESPLYEYFKRFFEELPDELPQGRRPLTAIGSGFIITSDGYILTNAHVVRGADEIIVGMKDRRELNAKVVGTDKRSDIALLKVEATDLPTVKIGDPKNLKVGQWVLAIGSPFGFEYTATQGIISALGRSLPSDSYVPFIQTDAAVNPGNSGGPLFNLNGEVIGINSQIYSRTGGYQGVSFAIPIDVAMDVFDQIKQYGKVARGWLGVMIQEVTPDLAQSFDLDQPKGALIGQVMKDSPAAKAGLQPGDIIIAFNNQPVETHKILPPRVGSIRPGTTVPVTIIRNRQEKTLSITIEELPDEPEKIATTERAISNRWNITVENLTAEQVKSGGEGVIVKRVGEGPAADSGIRVGDIIAQINRKDIKTVDEFEEQLNSLPAGKPVPVLIRRGENAQFLTVTITDARNESKK